MIINVLVKDQAMANGKKMSNLVNQKTLFQWQRIIRNTVGLGNKKSGIKVLADPGLHHEIPVV